MKSLFKNNLSLAAVSFCSKMENIWKKNSIKNLSNTKKGFVLISNFFKFVFFKNSLKTDN